MTADKLTTSTAVEHDTVKSVGKLLLATLALIWLLYLVSILPGVDRLVPGTPLTFAAIASAIGTITIVGLLLYLAPALAHLVRSTVTGPRRVVDDVASVVHLFVVLVAVLVAHRGLAPAIVPLFERLVGAANAGWMYDVLFLALALPPLAILAARVYVSLDPMSELLADRVTGSETAGSTGESSTATARDGAAESARTADDEP